MDMHHLSNGFFAIDEEDARRLNNGKLPRPGHEALVAYDSEHWWLARTVDQGKQVWSIRVARHWRLKDGVAVYRGVGED